MAAAPPWAMKIHLGRGRYRILINAWLALCDCGANPDAEKSVDIFTVNLQI